MNKKNLLFLALSFAFSCGYCDEGTNQKTQFQGLNMQHTKEHQKKKFFIGLELRTNNEECSSAMPAHKEKFFKENIPSKIPNKVNGNILALYTDYEGDYTKPYSWILGYEVSSLDKIPEGLVQFNKSFWSNFGAKARIIAERKLTRIDLIRINLRSLRSTILRNFRARNCLKNFC